MRKFSTTLVAAVLATSALTTAVYAAESKGPDTATQTTMQKDFTKLSTDGFNAMQNVRAARLAIFDAKPEKARKDLNTAMQSIEQAKTDHSSFMKAEGDLKPPAGVKQAKGDETNATDAKTQVAWLPINAAIGFDEDFSGKPAKVEGVKKANQQLKAGNGKQALDTLKLTDVNMDLVLEVAPLDKTAKAIDQASQMIDQGKYYEANQALMKVENNVRYDVVDWKGTPQKNAANTDATKNAGTADMSKTTGSSAATSGATTATTGANAASAPANNTAPPADTSAGGMKK